MYRRLELSTLLTVIGPLAIDACLVGSLVPATGPFCVDLEGIVEAGTYRLFGRVCLGGSSDDVL